MTPSKGMIKHLDEKYIEDQRVIEELKKLFLRKAVEIQRKREEEDQNKWDGNTSNWSNWSGNDCGSFGNTKDQKKWTGNSGHWNKYNNDK